MIYFKVDVGYYDYSNTNPSTGDKINDIVTITDKDRYYGIGTTYKESFPRGDKTIADFQNYCIASFGNDFYEVWLVPGVNSGYQVKVVDNGWIPWAGYMYPNLYTLFQTAGSSGNYKAGAIIFKTLNLLVIVGGGSTPSGTVFSINRDSTISRIGLFNGCNFSNQGFTFGFITNYIKGMELSSATCARLQAQVNATDARFSEIISNNEFLNYIFAENPIPDLIIDNDPYTPGGTNTPGGGTGQPGGVGGGGDFDGTSEPIDFPALPNISATDTGFITLFNPSTAELKNLANYMWGDLFDLNTWKKIFADPMDAILGMSIVPVSIPDGGTSEITVGNIPTGISMRKAGAQYIEIDCGVINVNEFWGAYLDYAPYTKAELYLPYIGIHPISIDDIMNKPVHIKYHVDILSGACCAYVRCGDSIIYSFIGQCSSSIPITGNDWTNVINGALSIAASIGTMVATGGASAPMAVSNIASTSVNSLKPSIEKSGAMGGVGGMLGVQSPYLILTRPRQALPEYQNKFTGYPSFFTAALSECSGYTEIESIHLENVQATEEEIKEIESILKSGVIL